LNRGGTAFVTHPITPAVKAHLNAQGLRVVDARHAGPEDDIIDGAALDAELATPADAEPELELAADTASKPVQKPKPTAPAQKAVKQAPKPASK